MKITKKLILKLDIQNFIKVLEENQIFLNNDQINFIKSLNEYNKQNYNKIFDIYQYLNNDKNYINHIENKYNFKVKTY